MIEPNCNCTFSESFQSLCNCSYNCGNGILEPQLFELCDDGNLLNGDGCNSSCKPEFNWNCTNMTGGKSICTNPQGIDIKKPPEFAKPLLD